jgi:hypothetical protein
MNHDIPARHHNRHSIASSSVALTSVIRIQLRRSRITLRVLLAAGEGAVVVDRAAARRGEREVYLAVVACRCSSGTL